MSDAYNQLLDATIQHLEGLKSRGVRHVAVSPETLVALTKPTPSIRPQPAAAPQPHTPVTTQPAMPARQKPQPAPPQPSLPQEPGRLPSSSLSSIRNGGDGDRRPGEKALRGSEALPPAEKAAAFAALRDRVLACVKCPNLASSRKTVVFGVGTIDAQLMFVGEAPGADEDEQGEPFVGKAGQLLTKIIETMGLTRSDVYIGNILKCRPDTPGETSGNRKPTTGEMATCIPYLHEQIDLIRPKVLVALGATAVEGLLGKTVGISKLRGNWQTYRGTPLMPTYHPAYLLRNQAMSEKRKVWEDMLQVMEKLAMPISEKQQRFFLKT